MYNQTMKLMVEDEKNQSSTAIKVLRKSDFYVLRKCLKPQEKKIGEHICSYWPQEVKDQPLPLCRHNFHYFQLKQLVT